MKNLQLNVSEFQAFVENKKIICFGAGKQGRRILDIMHNYGKLNDLLGFIDNNPQKWGTNFEYDGFSIPIFSIDNALDMIDEKTILLITCVEYTNVVNQLEAYDKFKEIEYISLTDISLNQFLVSDYDAVIKQYDEPVIPKKIHYCWFGKGEKPDLIKRNIEKWKQLCPDYEIIEWNESNYDFTKNQYMKQAYEKKKWAFVSDYARLDIIYNHGGIYIDTDVDMFKRPDELLYQDCFSTFDNTLTMATGAGLGARPRMEIIKEMRDYYDNVSFLKPDGTIDDTSCIMYNYAVLKKYGYKLNDKLQTVQGINIYPMIFQGTCSCLYLMKITPKTFWAHYATNTWLGNDMQKIRGENAENFQIDKKTGLIKYSL